MLLLIDTVVLAVLLATVEYFTDYFCCSGRGAVLAILNVVAD